MDLSQFRPDPAATIVFEINHGEDSTQAPRLSRDMSDMPEWMKKKKCPNRDKYLAGRRILRRNLTGKDKLVDIIDKTFLAYNSARLRECCQLFSEKMLDADVTIGMSFSGALTPAGLGCSSIVPLIKAGYVDWLVSTGAILYHDMHFALNYPVRAGSFKMAIPSCATTTLFACTMCCSATATA